MNIGTLIPAQVPRLQQAPKAPPTKYTYLPHVDKAIEEALEAIENGGKPYGQILEKVKQQLREDYILKALKRTSFGIDKDARGNLIYVYGGNRITASDLDKQISRDKWWGEKLKIIQRTLENAVKNKVYQNHKFEYEYISPLRKL